jgi:putative ABC transport system permease protein
MAWRDGRASLKRLALFMSAIVLGIAALVSIQNFGRTLEETISGQSRELMGSDYLIDSDHPANERVQGIIDSLGGPQSREVTFVSMAVFPGKEGSKLIRVRAMEGA